MSSEGTPNTSSRPETTDGSSENLVNSGIVPASATPAITERSGSEQPPTTPAKPEAEKNFLVTFQSRWLKVEAPGLAGAAFLAILSCFVCFVMLDPFKNQKHLIFGIFSSVAVGFLLGTMNNRSTIQEIRSRLADKDEEIKRMAAEKNRLSDYFMEERKSSLQAPRSAQKSPKNGKKSK